jgi:hypothetical protein
MMFWEQDWWWAGLIAMLTSWLLTYTYYKWRVS